MPRNEHKCVVCHDRINRKADGLPISSIQDHAIKQALRQENDAQTTRVHKLCARQPHKYMKTKVWPQLAQVHTMLRLYVMIVCTHING